MRRYLLRRVLALIPLLLGITIISFIIMNLAPGDPTAFYIDPSGTTSPEMVERIRKNLGLDQPLPVRYVLWLGKTVRGDLGYSFVSNRPVVKEVGDRVFNTLLLTVTSLLVALIFGVLVGVYSALNQYKLSDYILSIFTFIGISMPSFWFAMMMILLFTLKLGWLPSVGMSSSMFPPSTSWGRFADVIKHMIMPVTVSSLSSLASWARYQRSSMLEVIRQDYIRTARSKGLSNKVVIFRHALRNAALPIITLLGMSIPMLLSGSFIIETIFSWPGMGRLGVSSIFRRDYPVVMGVTLFSSLLVMGGNLIADIMYAVVDPRVRYK